MILDKLLKRCLTVLLFSGGLHLCYGQVIINEFMASNGDVLTDNFGDTSDWIELYNPSASPVSLLDWQLSDQLGNTNAWRFPAISIDAFDTLLVYASGRNITTNGALLHTDFKLRANGEYLALLEPDLSIATEFSPSFPPQEENISYGFISTNELRFFSSPTPDATNGVGFLGFVADTSFSIDRGFYTNAFNTIITVPTMGATLVYTTDSSEPSLSNGIQIIGSITNFPSATISITNTTVLRARAFKTNFEPSNTDTHSYIFLSNVIQQPANPANFPATWDDVNADYEMDPDITTNPTYAPQMLDALRSLPSLSISTDQTNLFDSVNGIYANPELKGVTWERASSVELFDADNQKEFQINCGLRIQGGFFRGRTRTQKHSFRLLFKNEYGPGRLKHDLFPGTDAVDSFDTLVLRAGANDGYSWSGAGTTVQWIRDNFAREIMNDLGQPASHGRFVHLYLNGLYWGMYNIVERPNEDFSADYFGGDSADWDANNAGDLKNGDINAWDALTSGSTSAQTLAEYYALMGLNPDGTRNLAMDILLDRDNYMDYMMLNIWGGNWDWPGKNFWFGRLQTANSTGFKFYMWDFENTMENNFGRSPLNMVTPRAGEENKWVGIPHNQLKDHPEYQIDFADRVHRAFFNDGELTPDRLIPRYMNQANIIESAVIAESARWGDDHANTPYNQQQWFTQRDRLINSYFPQRSDIVLGQFIAAGLYPSVDAPSFSQHGGIVPRGFELNMEAPQGTIYYTLDGSDPREIGGSLNTNAMIYTAQITLEQPLMINARVRDGSTWSALNQAQFIVDGNPIRISEIMLHPATLTSNEVAAGFTRDDFEFIELYNASSNTVQLSTLVLSDAIDFDFSTNTMINALGPTGTVLIVNNLAAFQHRYPDISTNTLIAGEYTRNLNNTSDHLILSEALTGVIQEITYDQDRSWPLAAFGSGHSLIPKAVEGLDYGPNWRASNYLNGSPGRIPPPLPQTIFLNEIAANTSNPSNDWVEVYAAASITLNNWFLSDDAAQLAKWPIPGDTQVNGWLTFDELTGFNNPPGNGFAFDRNGEQVFLSHLPGGSENRVVDAFSFSAQRTNQTWGRFPDGDHPFHPLVPTPNAMNAQVLTQVVIHEVMYHPKATDLHPEDNTADEYIVLQNLSSQPITLQNSDGPWRLSGEVGFTFATNTVLAAGAFLVITPFDPGVSADLILFGHVYGIATNEVAITGPFSGRLSNRVGHLALEQPQATGWSVVDELFYSDAPPFATQADGQGAALHRAGLDDWRPGAASPANEFIVLAPAIVTDAASDISWNSATLNGSLLDQGSTPPRVLAYYGTTDGGSNSNLWEHFIQLGYPPAGPLSVPVNNLSPNQPYFVRLLALAENAFTWSSESALFTTGEDPRVDFEHSRKITFPGYTKSEVLTNFPALVRFDPSNLVYTQLYSNAGTDLLFLDDQQTRLLPHEIESWTTNGTSHVWVQIPRLVSSNTCIWAYWGNTNAAFQNPIPTTPGLELWLDSSTLTQAGNTPVALWEDQSTMARDASEITNPPLLITNAINGHAAVRFDGVNDELRFSNSGLNAQTIVFVTRMNPGQKNLAGIIGRNGGDKGIRRVNSTGWRHDTADGNDFTQPVGSTFMVNGNDTASANEDTWHIAIATRNSTANTNYDSLGGYFNGREYAGDVAEVVLYNRILTIDEQHAIGRYLSTKYQIPAAYPGGSEAVPVANDELWSEHFRSVWHLSDQASDASTPPFDGSINSAIVNSNAVIHAGYQFDGTNDNITFEASIGAIHAITVSAWVRPDLMKTQTIFGKSPTDSSGAGFQLQLTQSGSLIWQVGSEQNNTSINLPSAYAAGPWKHLAATYQDNIARLYIDGVEQQSISAGQNITEAITPLHIGSSNSLTDYFQGSLDEVRIANTERTPCWILASFLNQKPGSTFTVLSSPLGHLIDSDNDQLPDQWEIAQFGNLLQSGESDTDGDGLSNLQEYTIQTDPAAPLSSLYLLPIEQPDHDLRTLLEWPSQRGVQYQLQRATSLDAAWSTIAENIAATPPINSWPILADAEKRLFYRIVVTP